MKEPIKRLLDFVESKGGIPKVSKMTGLTSSVFNNYNNPKRKNENVGGEVHVKMKGAFSDYSADYIITGIDEVGILRKRLSDEQLEKSKMQDFYIKKEMASSNFKDVDINNHLADRLEELNQLDDVRKTFWTSHSFLADMIDLTRND